MDTNKLKEDFIRIAQSAGATVVADDIVVSELPIPHKPGNLPKGKMAAYVFLLGDRCLKVGKVGPKSNARFLTQHYVPRSSRSNLANSILNQKDRIKRDLVASDRAEIDDLDDSTISAWIKAHTTRLDFFLDAKQPASVLNLLEAFLQCRLNPLFEGRLPAYEEEV